VSLSCCHEIFITLRFPDWLTIGTFWHMDNAQNKPESTARRFAEAALVGSSVGALGGLWLHVNMPLEYVVGAVNKTKISMGVVLGGAAGAVALEALDQRDRRRAEAASSWVAREAARGVTTSPPEHSPSR